MSSSSMRNPTNKRRARKDKRNNGGVNAGSVGFVSSCYVAARADTMFSRQDLLARPPSVNLRESPPLSLRNQRFWIKAGQSSTYTTPASPVPGQFSKSFFLSDIFDSTNFTKVFDQYCIYAVCISFVPSSTTTNTTNFGMITTVVDFTDITSLTLPSEAKSYSTSETSALVPGKPHMRYIEPCVSSAVYRPTTSAYGPMRAWVDILYPDAPHYGIKALFYDGSTPINIEVSADYLIGFRSQK